MSCRILPMNSMRLPKIWAWPLPIFISVPTLTKRRSSVRRSPSTASFILPPMVFVAGDVKGLAAPVARAQHSGTRIRTRRSACLTASEVAQLKLNADWVVLSAATPSHVTDRAQRRYRDWRASFFYAGRALLVSHWSVASEAATRLTASTLDRLKSNPKSAGPRHCVGPCSLSQRYSRHAIPFWGPLALIGEGAAR